MTIPLSIFSGFQASGMSAVTAGLSSGIFTVPAEATLLKSEKTRRAFVMIFILEGAGSVTIWRHACGTKGEMASCILLKHNRFFRDQPQLFGRLLLRVTGRPPVSRQTID